MAVMLDMRLRGLLTMMNRVQMMPVRQVGMMGSLLVVTRLIVLGRLLVVTGGVFVVLGSFVMMLMRGHWCSSPTWEINNVGLVYLPKVSTI
jgi:hypothetical protein